MSEKLIVGSPIPNFTLKDSDKNDVSPSNFKGKKLVVAFLPGAFTGVCDKEVCTLQDNIDNLSKLNANIIAITVDSIFVNKEFSKKYNLGFPVLSDYDRKVIELYGLGIENFAGLPGYTASNRAIYVSDENGVIQYAWVAPNPGVEPNYNEIQNKLSSI